MNILGINYIFHDSAACIVSGGELVVAVAEERMTRERHTQKFPQHSIDACFKQAGIKPSEIDHIAVSVQPGQMIPEKLAYAARLNGSAHSFLAYEFHRCEARHLQFFDWLHRLWPRKEGAPRIHWIEHHAAHAQGSFYVSPYEKAALLSVDGWGEWTTTWLGYADQAGVKRFAESFFPHSLGVFYSAATEFCGFGINCDEGKTMGLAPTGDPTRFYSDVASMVRTTPSGEVELDMSWFDFGTLGGRLCSDKFHRRFGEPRTGRNPIERHHKDIAAAFQRVLEERVLELCTVLERETGVRALVLSGGVALNSVMNGRVLRDSRFKDIYVMPAAGDDGTCIGAAFQVHCGVLGQPKSYRHLNPFLGTEYSDQEIRGALEGCKLTYTHSSDSSFDAARLLQAGRIIGWFQGRMEFGPRALGNRSILANPGVPGMKDRLNAEVKHREAFRPFAPSVPVERRDDYFDIDVDSPFMLQVCPVRESRRNQISAIVHVDGSARLQTVEREINPRYHQLLVQFGALSGTPVLLNTSFNVMGEPIIESPHQAIRCFYSTGLDDLVIGDYIISK